VKQSQARTDNFLYRIYNRPQNLVGNHFVRVIRQALSQRSPPSDSQFGVDVDNIDSSCNCLLKVSIIGSRPTVQSEKRTGGLLDLGDSCQIQVLLRLSLHHALKHAMHVANVRSEIVNPGRIYELARFPRCGQVLKSPWRSP